MRKIKFRGKTKETNQWVYGYYRYDNLPNEYYILWDNQDGTCGYKAEVYSSTIGQYAGLKDMAGKEIYEGDIILTIRGIKENPIEFLSKVEWDNETAGFILKGITKPYTEYFDDFLEVEIIGNIYDNSELLSKEEQWGK